MAAAGGFDLAAALANNATMQLVGTNPYKFAQAANGNVILATDPGPGVDHIMGIMAHARGWGVNSISVSPDDGPFQVDGQAVAIDPELFEYARSVVANFETYQVWTLFLVACAQGSGVKEENLEQFFQMNGAKASGISKICKLLVYLAAEMPNLVENEDVRAKFAGNDFFKYRISQSQSGVLCLRAIEICPLEGVFSDAERAIVQAAKDTPWSLEAARAIPEHVLFKARAVLQGMEVLPSPWYMAKRAYENGSPAQYNSLVKLVKKAASIQEGFSFDDTTTMEEINGIVDNLTWLHE